VAVEGFLEKIKWRKGFGVRLLSDSGLLFRFLHVLVGSCLLLVYVRLGWHHPGAIAKTLCQMYPDFQMVVRRPRRPVS
jgi:hypothetical protein